MPEIAAQKYERNRPFTLPKTIKAYLARRYVLTPAYLKTLRCFIKEDNVSGKPIMRLIIYSHGTAREFGIRIQREEDLSNFQQLLLYVGSFEANRNIYIEDRRSSHTLWVSECLIQEQPVG